jgi:hypothetical protein
MIETEVSSKFWPIELKENSDYCPNRHQEESKKGGWGGGLRQIKWNRETKHIGSLKNRDRCIKRKYVQLYVYNRGYVWFEDMDKFKEINVLFERKLEKEEENQHNFRLCWSTRGQKWMMRTSQLLLNEKTGSENKQAREAGAHRMAFKNRIPATKWNRKLNLRGRDDIHSIDQMSCTKDARVHPRNC